MSSSFYDEWPGLAIFLMLIGSCVGWCLLAHCILLPCCTCLKRRHKLNETSFFAERGQPFKILAAHRGGGAERCENTLSAFNLAVEKGMNLLELDVYLSLDEEVVINHDATLGRLCGEEHAESRIGQFAVADLPPMKRAFRMGLTPGTYEMRDDEDGKFTLLKDLFATAPNHILYSIDLKGANTVLCRKVNELVKEYKKEDKVVWGSMFKEQHAIVTDLNPNVSLFYSGNYAIRTYLCWLGGCLFCFPLKGDMMMTTHMSTTQMERIRSMLVSAGRDNCLTRCMVRAMRFVHLRSRGLFQHLKARGNGTVIWVANEHEEFTELKEIFGDSLDGVMTDIPSNLASYAYTYQQEDQRRLINH